ncbi:MAG: hypothetical protein NZ529_01580 [Cytophagaceae bacterium]|nr:hypothetical protein [Cytophagaceae bacterium]MDW8455457.1 hypothetical protein [Cytophagaceae bacterium]
MNTSKIDYLNIGLMLASCAVAIFFPFELFLFSYAVLGPLHYLTEIPWLHQKDYFSASKRDYWALIVLCALLSVGVIWVEIFSVNQLFPNVFKPETIEFLQKHLVNIFPAIVLASLGWALGMAFIKHTTSKILLLVGCAIAGLLLQNVESYKLWVGVMIPTLVHVYVFTGMFILYGALKHKSISGLLSLIVFVCCGVFVFYFPFLNGIPAMNEYVRNAIVKSGFLSVNEDAITIFENNLLASNDHYESKYIMQRFIAFAYTYHYLNWFSKTGIIKWHKVPLKWLIPAALIWICSLALYAYDYRVGLIVLFFLSMLHVFLEFPLNFKTLFAILQEIKNIVFTNPVKPIHNK